MAHIALVEDDSTVSNTMVKILERAGHQIDTFANAPEALAGCDFAQVDLVITDLIMESRNREMTQGEELIQALRREYPLLPIMVVTGAVVDRIDELRECGVSSLVRKPFEPKALVEAVAELV